MLKQYKLIDFQPDAHKLLSRMTPDFKFHLLPCHRSMQSQQCALPEDVKQFYQSNDGMKLEWSYQYNGEGICDLSSQVVVTLVRLALNVLLRITFL